MVIEQIERTILFAGITALSILLCAQPASADEDDDRGAGIRTVHCDRSNVSVQKKIDKAGHGKPVTIVIKGTCTENIVVQKDDLTLLAHPAGSGTVEGSIDVVGAQRVIIDGLRVTGSGDVVTARDNASIIIINGTFIKSDGGSAVFATRSASVVMENTTLEATGRFGCAAFISDGSALRMNGGNTLTNDDRPGFNCGTLSIYRSATARIRGSDNTITNNNPVTGDPNSGDAGGFALDANAVSSLRIDGTDQTVVNGNVSSFNLSTIDLRKAEINGGIYADGLNANVRLRGNEDNDVIVNGHVFPGGDSAVAIRNDGEVVINGNIDCSNGANVRPNFEFFGPGFGYLNCPPEYMPPAPIPPPP